MRVRDDIVIECKNIFSVLSLDSDSDCEKAEVAPSVEVVPASAEVVPAPSEEGKASKEKEKGTPDSPPFRVWNIEEGAKRFVNDDSIFSNSPFSRKKSISWTKPRFKEGDEGWTSIQVEPEEKVPEATFQSLLTRGIQTPETKDMDEALLWAEKVKKNLEKAELSRYENKSAQDKSIDSLNKLSFFRRNVVHSDSA